MVPPVDALYFNAPGVASSEFAALPATAPTFEVEYWGWLAQ